jgi:hypothetical protein
VSKTEEEKEFLLVDVFLRLDNEKEKKKKKKKIVSLFVHMISLLEKKIFVIFPKENRSFGVLKLFHRLFPIFSLKKGK